MSNQKNDILEGFKMTELGLIPEEWRVVKLRDDDNFHILTSGIQFFAGSKKYLSTSSIQGSKIESPECSITYNKRPSRANMQPVLGSVWFAKMIGTKKVYSFTDENVQEISEYILSTGFCGILCRADVDPSYMKFVFLSDFFNTVKDSLCSGATQRAINNENTGSIQISLPPLPEQKAIAGVLSIIQKAIEAQDKIIAAAREFKKSLVSYLFTYGLAPFSEAERVSLKETEIGPVPEHWDVVRLGEIIEKPEYGYTATASFENVGPKFLRITDIQNGRVTWTSVPFCQCSTNDVRKYLLRSGDILFARIGATTGKTFLVDESPSAIFASYLIRVCCKSSLLPAYLDQFTNTQIYWGQINASKGGRLKQGINIPVLKSLLIALAPKSEQQEIANVLAGIDKKIETEENHKMALQTLFKTMLHLLMTGKVRVKDLEVSVS